MNLGDKWTVESVTSEAEAKSALPPASEMEGAEPGEHTTFVIRAKDLFGSALNSVWPVAQGPVADRFVTKLDEPEG